ncbi:hypothetical protein SLNSH_18560 [Alsobacter soli]|uniref:Uncharacterized protein n=1 Tax=Alsobacter soli TaxID=2109933 RepID=A0A2T1HPD6_9HYPH|nr:hypothetical protein [Alsobacter soli]PSC03514.1 hypothetical protein SLNSH_18560 [Alsobacter soli]
MARFDSNTRRQPDIDFDAIIDSAKRDREQAMGHTLRFIGSLSPITKRGIAMGTTAFLVAAAMFWTVMLTSPPRSEADTRRAAGASTEASLPGFMKQVTNVTCHTFNSCP